MTDATRSTRTVNAAIAEGLEQTQEIALAATDVLKSITSVMVPLSVYLFPKSEQLIPAIDSVVDRSFGMVTTVIERQFEIGFAAFSKLETVASN